MEKISQKDINELLNGAHSYRIGTIHQQEKKKDSSFGRKVTRVCIWSGLVFGLTIMPFFVLIRTSVYLNLTQGFNGWLALIGGIIATVSVLLVYLFFLFRKVKNKKLLIKYGSAGIGALVAGFCLYGTLYLSSINAKSSEIQSVYRSLHPILRVAVATTTLAEDNLVITDIGRTPEDYGKMGLTALNNSLHYKQSDGYVHAIDLRTKGHSGVRNFILKSSLKFMGFKVIRHVCTADHLHVSLPVSE